MKFEKHLKNCGMFATVFKASNGDLYLGAGLNAGTLILCPKGFTPMSANVEQTLPEPIDEIVTMIENGTYFDAVDAELCDATIPKDGRLADVVRIFADSLGNVVCPIVNADYGLLERVDHVKIARIYTDTTSDLVLIVTDPNESKVVGIIPAFDQK